MKRKLASNEVEQGRVNETEHWTELFDVDWGNEKKGWNQEGTKTGHSPELGLLGSQRLQVRLPTAWKLWLVSKASVIVGGIFQLNGI